MPEGLEDWLKQHAQETGRTLNAAIVSALEDYRARQGGSAPAPPAPEPPAPEPPAARRAAKVQPHAAPRAPKTRERTTGKTESPSDMAAFITRRARGDHQ
jgi:hypothetical protein